MPALATTLALALALARPTMAQTGWCGPVLLDRTLTLGVTASGTTVGGGHQGEVPATACAYSSAQTWAPAVTYRLDVTRAGLYEFLVDPDSAFWGWQLTVFSSCSTNLTALQCFTKYTSTPPVTISHVDTDSTQVSTYLSAGMYAVVMHATDQGSTCAQDMTSCAHQGQYSVTVTGPVATSSPASSPHTSSNPCGDPSWEVCPDNGNYCCPWGYDCNLSTTPVTCKVGGPIIGIVFAGIFVFAVAAGVVGRLMSNKPLCGMSYDDFRAGTATTTTNASSANPRYFVPPQYQQQPPSSNVMVVSAMPINVNADADAKGGPPI